MKGFRKNRHFMQIPPFIREDTPRFAGGNFFVYEDMNLQKLLGKKVVGVFTHPVCYIQFEDGMKLAIFGTEYEVHIWQDKNKKE